MQLHELQPVHAGKTKKRIGRGGKRGDNSGTGHKGQKSRAGHKMNPALHELLIRIPKLRGFKNKPLFGKAMGVNIGVIDKKVEGSIITLETLVAAGIIRKSDKQVKILGTGEVTRALNIKGLEVSKTAQDKIETKGGKVEAPTKKEA